MYEIFMCVHVLCFIIHAPLAMPCALKSVSQFSLLAFSILKWHVDHISLTNKLSAGFFYWNIYKSTAYHQRGATENVFRVPECYVFSFFDHLQIPCKLGI